MLWAACFVLLAAVALMALDDHSLHPHELDATLVALFANQLVAGFAGC